jgi:predicted proteasome-type protease
VEFRLQRRSAAAGTSLGRRILEERVTYCLGILLPGGLVLGSDARSTAGADPMALVEKLADATSPDEAAKLSLLSFDATMRCTLSVDAPIDLFRYCADSFSARNFATLEKDDTCWMALRKHYAEGLSSLVASIPPPPNLA